MSPVPPTARAADRLETPSVAGVGDEVGPDEALTTKEGWRRFVDHQPQPPELLSAGALAGLSGRERARYDDARRDYHCDLPLVSTPTIRQTITTSRLLITSARSSSDRGPPRWKHVRVVLQPLEVGAHPSRAGRRIEGQQLRPGLVVGRRLDVVRVPGRHHRDAEVQPQAGFAAPTALDQLRQRRPGLSFGSEHERHGERDVADPLLLRDDSTDALAGEIKIDCQNAYLCGGETGRSGGPRSYTGGPGRSLFL